MENNNKQPSLDLKPATLYVLSRVRDEYTAHSKYEYLINIWQHHSFFFKEIHSRNPKYKIHFVAENPDKIEICKEFLNLITNFRADIEEEDAVLQVEDLDFLCFRFMVLMNGILDKKDMPSWK